MKTAFAQRTKKPTRVLKAKNLLWDLPKIAVKTGKGSLSKQVDSIVYGG